MAKRAVQAKPKSKAASSKRPAKMGAPSSYSQTKADEMCRRLGDGESLRTICRDEHMPDKATVFRWLADRQDFRDHYARAREVQAASYADDIVDISDNEPDPQKARIRIDARKWHASKLAPKKYGDRIELAGDEKSPLVIVQEAGRALDAKLDRLIARAIGKAEE